MKIVASILFILALFIALPFAFVQFFPEKALSLALDAERNKSDLVRKEIYLEKDFHYVFLEGGKGEALMLLHGFGANKDNFTRTARFLTPHYRVIIPDHIGFGESSRPEEASYTPKAQAKRLHELALRLGISRIHLGGNSMGGQIAMVYATLYPENVESLWLLNPGGLWDGPMTDMLKDATDKGKNALLIEREEDLIVLESLVMEKPPFIPKAFLKVMARQRMAYAPLEKEIFNQILAHTITEDIKGLEIPSLIVWGNQDNILHPDNARRLHALLPRSELIFMEGIGHLPMVEAPEESAEDYLRFREKLLEKAITEN